MTDQLYKEAVQVVAQNGKASTKLLQDRMLIGYSRALLLIERMREERVINANNMYQCW
jgi:S-DNA-T family DNA segregation ATPase FtsK/SpoIIIE